VPGALQGGVQEPSDLLGGEKEPRGSSTVLSTTSPAESVTAMTDPREFWW